MALIGWGAIQPQGNFGPSRDFLAQGSRDLFSFLLYHFTNVELLTENSSSSFRISSLTSSSAQLISTAF